MIPIVPNLINPVLIDYSLQELREMLVFKIGWLDHAFSIAQISVKKIGNKTIKEPACYIGEIEYKTVLPNTDFGNYIWFERANKDDVNTENSGKIELKTQLDLKLWFDYRKIYPNDWEQRTIENVKDELLSALSGWLNYSKITIESIGEDLGIDEIQDQYRLRPYGALNVRLTVNYSNIKGCEGATLPPYYYNNSGVPIFPEYANKDLAQNDTTLNIGSIWRLVNPEISLSNSLFQKT